MRKTIVALLAVAALAGCTTAEKDAAAGGVAGAVIGGLVSGDAGGAAIGGVIGAAGAVLVGQAARKGWCVYRDSRGRLYEARCRAG
ncbi:MAG: lipoprotein [Rhizobiaceae bacterium]|nr:lipoprotein [Rhizobiaceae bacterium]